MKPTDPRFVDVGHFWFVNLKTNEAYLCEEYDHWTCARQLAKTFRFTPSSVFEQFARFEDNTNSIYGSVGHPISPKEFRNLQAFLQDVSHGRDVYVSFDDATEISGPHARWYVEDVRLQDILAADSIRDVAQRIQPNPHKVITMPLIPGGKKFDYSRFDPKQLAAGIKVEAEHTSRRDIAREIAAAHLTEDPKYYVKLARMERGACNIPHRNPTGVVRTKRDERLWSTAKTQVDKEYPNVKHGSDRYWALVNGIFQRMKHRTGGSAPTSTKKNPDIEYHYEYFHGVAPDVFSEKQAWIPGAVVRLGTGVDVGYGIVDARSKKDGYFVHDFNSGVEIFRRAKPGETPDRIWGSFPTNLMILGRGLGFTYEDENGQKHEIKGKTDQKLVVDDSRKILAIVGTTGVDYVMVGGNMHVEDWIYD